MNIGEPTKHLFCDSVDIPMRYSFLLTVPTGSPAGAEHRDELLAHLSETVDHLQPRELELQRGTVEVLPATA